MNKFGQLGFIKYNGDLQVHSSLLWYYVIRPLAVARVQLNFEPFSFRRMMASAVARSVLSRRAVSLLDRNGHAP
jgi:hypothetical protein